MIEIDPDYLRAVVPSPFRVLGCGLRPFCLGHLLLLQRIESPLLVGGDVMQDDLLQAVMLCSRGFEDAQLLLGNPGEMTAEIAEWRHGISRFWRRIKIDWQESAETFREYLEEGGRRPMVKTLGNGGPQPGAPTVEIITLKLLHWGFSQSDVMNMHLPRLWYAYYTACELDIFASARDLNQVRNVFPTPQERAYLESRRG